MTTTFPIEHTFEPDTLLTGPRDWYKTMPVTIAVTKDTPIERGTLVKYDTSTKKVAAVTAATDEVFGILTETVSADADGDVETLAYVAGNFNTESVKTGAEAVAASDFLVSARNVGIILE